MKIYNVRYIDMINFGTKFRTVIRPKSYCSGYVKDLRFMVWAGRVLARGCSQISGLCSDRVFELLYGLNYSCL